MAAKVFIEVESSDLSAIARELERIAKVCDSCAEVLEKSGKPLKSAGLKHTIDGLEALTNVCANVIGPYQSESPGLGTIREKLGQAKSLTTEKIETAAGKAKAKADGVFPRKKK
jgi:hypothetical protein